MFFPRKERTLTHVDPIREPCIFVHTSRAGWPTVSAPLSLRLSLSCLSCLVLSCLVLSCLVLSCLVLSCLVLSCLVLSCLVLSCLSCLVLSCLVLSCLVLSCLVLSCLVLSCLVLSCLVLSCLFFFLLSVSLSRFRVQVSARVSMFILCLLCCIMSVCLNVYVLCVLVCVRLRAHVCLHFFQKKHSLSPRPHLFQNELECLFGWHDPHTLPMYSRSDFGS